VTIKIKTMCLALAFATAATPALAQESLRQTITGLFGATGTAPATAQLEWGFSPEGSAIALVLKVIGSARRSIHVMAYVMSNPEITGALARAARAGIEVYVQVDYKENVEEDRRGFIRNRLNELARAGVTVCTVAAFPIYHDKVIIVDGRNLETGSFNYSTQAANRNSENALVLWNSPQIASAYEEHFRARIPMCQAYQAG
jgi:phosphatidylserine/phosphatidylglycerophosphate/cardiolipin synthase-like enzyme